jgi:iron-sulfur cluster assembly accessory protein
MSVEVYEVSGAVVSASPAAAAHLKNQVSAKGKSALRLSVKESGCTGYMYVMEEVDEARDGDVIVELENGLSVYVDADSVPYLRGTRLDYVQQGINRTLQFDNPNVSVACGCGESFDIDAKAGTA